MKAGVSLRKDQQVELPKKADHNDQEEVPSSGTCLGGKYHLLESGAKGQGSFGTVYVVQEKKSFRLYVAKVETIHRTLEHEINMLNLLSDPGHRTILPVQDARVMPGGLSWFTMPMVECNVWGYLKDNSLSPNSQKALFWQLMDGLAYIHERNIIHADVKPTNILYNPRVEHFFVSDFGAARKLPISREIKCDCAYTICYRPPELLDPRLSTGQVLR